MAILPLISRLGRSHLCANGEKAWLVLLNYSEETIEIPFEQSGCDLLMRVIICGPVNFTANDMAVIELA